MVWRRLGNFFPFFLTDFTTISLLYLGLFITFFSHTLFLLYFVLFRRNIKESFTSTAVNISFIGLRIISLQWISMTRKRRNLKKDSPPKKKSRLDVHRQSYSYIMEVMQLRFIIFLSINLPNRRFFFFFFFFFPFILSYVLLLLDFH